MYSFSDLDKALSSKIAHLRYKAAKEIMLNAEKDPTNYYQYFDEIVKKLDHENPVIKCHIMRTIAAFAPIDVKDKITPLLAKFYELLAGPDLTVSTQAISSLVKIASSKKNSKSDIIKQILKVAEYKFPTAECNNIAIGNVLDELNNFIDELSQDQSIISFIKTASKNPRKSTKTKARLLLKKLGI